MMTGGFESVYITCRRGLHLHNLRDLLHWSQIWRWLNVLWTAQSVCLGNPTPEWCLNFISGNDLTGLTISYSQLLLINHQWLALVPEANRVCFSCRWNSETDQDMLLQEFHQGLWQPETKKQQSGEVGRSSGSYGVRSWNEGE